MSELATGPAAGTQIDANSSAVSTNWWRIGDAIVLALYSSVVLWTVGYHEKWADEAQAWLLARDLDLKTLWFHELRYEGSPGLWHTILYTAQHVFHMRYDSLGYLGAAFAIAGAAVLIFKAPFPRYIRWPLAFTYVMVYQYAVIARPYTMLPLLCFLVAIFFKDTRHPVKMTVVLVLLALLTLHGTIIAGCLGLAYLTEAAPGWKAFDPQARNKFFICSAVMAFTFLFVVLTLKPTPDVAEFAFKRALAEAPQSLRDAQPTSARKLISVVSGAFLDEPVSSVLLIALLGVWCFTRRKSIAFGLPVASLIVLYTLVHGYPHHHGAVFIAAIMGLWIAWPTRVEELHSSPRSGSALLAVKVLLLVLCALNIVDAVVTIKHEYQYPYSGAEDAARYLAPYVQKQVPMFGYKYGMVGVEAFFDHKVFENKPAAYYHQGTPFVAENIALSELDRDSPEFVVFCLTENIQKLFDDVAPSLEAHDYEFVHFSDGYYIYKRAVWERQAYFIFRRTHSLAEQTPWQSGHDR